MNNLSGTYCFSHRFGSFFVSCYPCPEGQGWSHTAGDGGHHQDQDGSSYANKAGRWGVPVMKLFLSCRCDLLSFIVSLLIGLLYSGII